ncbi:HEPN domain-containing protein [Candidatus Pacearchaeota archaeon]|nr:HEPN domain-containing protein [Candidatus Pacearchaeota archaeon]
MKKIEFYLKEGQVARDKTVANLSQKYLDKAKNNLITMKILFELNDKKARDSLKIPRDYDSNEWVVIAGYYAMYAAALALLAKIGFRSKNHAATLIILEEYFVKKKHLDETDFTLIKNAQFQKEEIEKISDARHKREIAQYSITKETTRSIAEKIIADAYDFVNKVEEIIKK